VAVLTAKATISPRGTHPTEQARRKVAARVVAVLTRLIMVVAAAAEATALTVVATREEPAEREGITRRTLEAEAPVPAAMPAAVEVTAAAALAVMSVAVTMAVMLATAAVAPAVALAMAPAVVMMLAAAAAAKLAVVPAMEVPKGMVGQAAMRVATVAGMAAGLVKRKAREKVAAKAMEVATASLMLVEKKKGLARTKIRGLQTMSVVAAGKRRKAMEMGVAERVAAGRNKRQAGAARRERQGRKRTLVVGMKAMRSQGAIQLVVVVMTKVAVPVVLAAKAKVNQTMETRENQQILPPQVVKATAAATRKSLRVLATLKWQADRPRRGWRQQEWWLTHGPGILQLEQGLPVLQPLLNVILADS
jgi:hypothetical protein